MNIELSAAPVFAAAMKTAASNAANSYFIEHYQGVDQGACGFAWVNIIPQHKGNTKLGKAERKVYRAMGFELDYTGKMFMMWNPSQLGCQNVDVKEAGARAAAEVLSDAGVEAYAASRLD